MSPDSLCTLLQKYSISISDYSFVCTGDMDGVSYTNPTLTVIDIAAVSDIAHKKVI